LKVFDLDLFDSHYYIKRSTIVKQIQFKNRTFYAKFERIDETLTPLIIKQHLNKEYTIAVPLVENNLTNYLVVEYKGEERTRFYHLIQHLFKTLKIEDYQIYEGHNKDRIIVFIAVKNYTLKKADNDLEIISSALKEKIIKNWKCLPSSSLPNEYNIITLPYKVYSNS